MSERKEERRGGEGEGEGRGGEGNKRGVQKSIDWNVSFEGLRGPPPVCCENVRHSSSVIT